MVVLVSNWTLRTDQILIFFLVLQKQVQTLPVDHSNNSKMEDMIILLIISIWNTSINKIQSNISSNNHSSFFETPKVGIGIFV